MRRKINKKELIKGLGILAAGMVLGWLIFHRGPTDAKAETAVQNKVHTHDHNEQGEETIWTCSMHPQVRMDAPGKCPICGMDLIPLDNLATDEASSQDELSMTASAMKLADIQTVFVTPDYPVRPTPLLGKVTADESRISSLTARFGGRIEKLYINFTGQHVNQGEKLASIYAPGLVAAQQELLEASKYRETNPAFYKSARTKLKLWDLTDSQIDDLEKGKEVQHYFSVLSPVTGTVTVRHIALGDYVKEGEPLFEVIDLSKVWVMFEAYENDLPWIRKGDEVKFSIHSLPGKTFHGKISFIDPVISLKTRIARARVDIDNPGGRLKPGMFADGVVEGRIGNKKSLTIPKSSVLWTGKRAVVYVKIPGREQSTFRYREIILGPDAGDAYVVASGLGEGEEIATHGVFMIDAAAQLAGKPSMMNPSGGTGTAMQHHAGMEMSATHASSADSAQTLPTTTKDKQSNITAISTFKKQLTVVVNQYLNLKDALVATDETKAVSAAGAALKALKKVNMELLQDDEQNIWRSLLIPLTENLEGITTMKGIEMKRTHFIIVSEKMIQAVKAFGTEEPQHLYLDFCPMANNNNGAFWISQFTEIRNPYFGEKMLTCGEIKDTLQQIK